MSEHKEPAPAALSLQRSAWSIKEIADSLKSIVRLLEIVAGQKAEAAQKKPEQEELPF